MSAPTKPEIEYPLATCVKPLYVVLLLVPVTVTKLVTGVIVTLLFAEFALMLGNT